MVLFSIASLHEDFRNARRFEDARANHPVGYRAKIQKLLRIRVVVRFVKLTLNLKFGGTYVSEFLTRRRIDLFDPLCVLDHNRLPSREVVSIAWLPNREFSFIRLRYYLCHKAGISDGR